VKRRSIEFRLAVWYFVVFAGGLAAFSVLAFFAMRASLYHATDDELRDRVRGVESFMDRQISALSLPEIRDEFREHSVLGPGGDLFQVCDAGGQWLYRSVPLESAGIPIRTPSKLVRPEFADITIDKHLLRFYSQAITVNGKAYTVQVAALMNEGLEALGRFRALLVLASPLLLLAASVGGYWLSIRALTPFDRISNAARRIGIENLTDRLEVPETGDQLQRLSLTLNEMFASLESSVRRIRQFTADASHELRAPITLIRTTAEVAVQKNRSAEEYREALDEILGESERTSQVLDSLMLLARADSGREALELLPSDLSAIIREAAEQGEKLAKNRGIDFSTEIVEGPVPVNADKDALRRALLVLMDNAAKYTPSGGAVHVRLTMQNGHGVASVEDTGIGIDPQDHERVFDRFWRADKARSREGGGAGLGLSIAKWIVEAHRGSIQLRSEVGRGSSFRILLPLDR
jgi:heavy metal sensor kinase